VSHEWHNRYSRPFTKVFGPVACKTEPRILGIGEGERYCKHDKNYSKGNRSNIAPSKVMKQAVISAAYSHQANEARRVRTQTAGVLWNDQDFEYCKFRSLLFWNHCGCSEYQGHLGIQCLFGRLVGPAVK